MILKKFSCYIVTLLICSLIFGCSKNISFPKIEDGIFADKRKEYYGSKKLTITSGDTLKSISRRFSVSIRELINYNALKPPYVLKPGKTILIPSAKKYKIKKGDSLYKIAKCSNINLEDIKQRNKNIQERKLKIGKVIKLPYFSNINNCKKLPRKISKKKKKQKIIKKIFKWPVSGEVVETFGIKKSGRRNDGINIKAPSGSPIRAARSGKVIYRGNELLAWGNLILIKHTNGWTTAYAHLEKFYVELGEQLKTGDIVGAVGKTGNVFDYQLHFQVRKNSKPLDPLKYLYK